MRFLVDESTGKKFATLLSKKHNVVYVGDFLHSAEDEKILSIAEKEKRVLITDDKDFGELVFRLGKPSKGVLFIRTKTMAPEKRFQLVAKLLKSIKVEGKFIVLTEKSMRVRQLK